MHALRCLDSGSVSCCTSSTLRTSYTWSWLPSGVYTRVRAGKGYLRTLVRNDFTGSVDNCYCAGQQESGGYYIAWLFSAHYYQQDHWPGPDISNIGRLCQIYFLDCLQILLHACTYIQLRSLDHIPDEDAQA